MKSHLTADFLKCFSTLPDRIKVLAKENYKLWQENPSHPSIAFKKVGKKYPVYSVRVGLGWRAIGFKEKDTMVWFWIGSHPKYERLIQSF